MTDTRLRRLGNFPLDATGPSPGQGLRAGQEASGERLVSFKTPGELESHLEKAADILQRDISATIPARV